MGEPAQQLRIYDPDAAAAERPAGEAGARSETGPRIVAEPMGLIPGTDLVPIWLDGETDLARERAVRRHGEALQQNPKTAHLAVKVAGKWYFEPLGPSPDAPPESGATLRDFMFLRTGKVGRDMLGVYIPPALAERIPGWTEKQRARFFAMCELARQLPEHEQRFGSLDRAERDRLFFADPDRKKWCASKGITRWSARSVREWCAKVESGLNPDLRGRPRLDEGDRAETFSPEAQMHFRVQLTTTQLRLSLIYRDVVRGLAASKGWSVPSIATVRRWATDQLPPSILDYHRLGPRKWAAKYGSYIQRDITAQYRPNQCWVGDHHQLDVWVFHQGKWVRPWLSAWMDMSSRRIVGWWISLSPNSDTLLAAFRVAVLEHGAPEEILVDNGKDYRARGVTGGKAKLDQEQVNGIMGRLGITVHWAQAYHPQSKPIERLFGRVCEEFSKRFATYCGSSPLTRPDALNEQLRAGTISATGLEEASALFGAWVDVYHNSPHSGEGMDNRTPAEVFACNPICKRTAERPILDLLLMRIERVKVGRNGVRFRGTWYGQRDMTLFRLQGTDVDLRVDPLDASHVLVFDTAGRFITDARNERLRGTTPDDIREGARYKAACRKLAKSAAAAGVEGLYSVEQHAQRLAAERRHLEREAEQRKAVVGQEAPPARDVQLLPGAAAMAPAVRKLRMHRPDDKAAEAAGADLACRALDLLMDTSHCPAPPPPEDDAGTALLDFVSARADRRVIVPVDEDDRGRDRGADDLVGAGQGQLDEEQGGNKSA